MSKIKNHRQKTGFDLEKWLKYGVYLTALIPLVIFSQFMSPFHFGKVVVFRLLVEILAAGYVFLLIREGQSRLPPKTPLFWSITFFTFAFGLATFFSINFFQSFFGTLERMGGWFSFLHFWLFFAVASAILEKREDWILFIKISLAVSVLSAFYGFLQKTDFSWVIGSGGRNKIFGTIGNPALFAGYMIVNAFLALMLYFRPGNAKNEKYFYGAAFLIGVLAILMAGVRGSVLAVIIGTAIFGFLCSFNLGSPKIKKYTIYFLIAVVAVAGILYFLRNADFVKESHYLSRYADLSLKSFTVQTRFWAWRAGFDGWNDSVKSMIFGWGPEMFNIPFSKHFNPKFFRGLGSETLFDRAHNQFLEVLFTMGLIGFAAYVFIFYRAFGALRKLNDTTENKVFRLGLISTLVAYMIHNFFIFDTSANYLMFFLVLGFLNFLGQSQNNANTRINPVSGREGPQRASAINGVYANNANKRPQRNLLANAVGLILTFIIAFSVYNFEIGPARANYATTRAIVASWDKNHDLAFELFKKAMTYDTFGKYDIRHRYGQYVLERTANLPELDKKMEGRLLLAVENIKKNAEESPQDYLPYLYISRAYIILGKNDPASEYNDLALEASSKALAISPSFVRTHYEIAQAYLNKKDYRSAVEWFEKAVKLNPEIGLSHWYWGITVAQSGDYRRAAEIIENSRYDYKSSEQDALRILDIYVKLGNFKKVAETYEALIKLNSKDPQYFASLAASYKILGEKEKAIKAAQAAARLDPSFAAQAEAFINSLR